MESHLAHFNSRKPSAFIGSKLAHYQLKNMLKPHRTPFSKLSRLNNRVEEEQESTAIVRAALREREAAHCVGASVRGKTLVILADSSAWANRLRFRSQDLLNELKQIERFAAVEEVTLVTNATLAAQQRDPSDRSRR